MISTVHVAVIVGMQLWLQLLLQASPFWMHNILQCTREMYMYICSLVPRPMEAEVGMRLLCLFFFQLHVHVCYSPMLQTMSDYALEYSGYALDIP